MKNNLTIKIKKYTRIDGDRSKKDRFTDHCFRFCPRERRREELGRRKGALSRERLCSLEFYRSGTASAHVCPERIDIWMSATRKKWSKKHRKGNIFRASNMSVVDFDFSPVSGPRKVITPARCSITDQAGSPSLPPSLSFSLAFEGRTDYYILSLLRGNFRGFSLCRVDEFHRNFSFTHVLPPNIFRRGNKSPGKIEITWEEEFGGGKKIGPRWSTIR